MLRKLTSGASVDSERTVRILMHYFKAATEWGAATLLMFALSGPVALSGQPSSFSSRLQLEQQAVYDLPDDFVVQHLARLPSGSILLWNSASGGVYVLDVGGQFRRWNSESHLVIGLAVVEDQDRVEILDAGKSALFSYDYFGNSVGVVALPLPDRALEAVRHNGYWIVGSIEIDGSYSVSSVAPGRILLETSREARSEKIRIRLTNYHTPLLIEAYSAVQFHQRDATLPKWGFREDMKYTSELMFGGHDSRNWYPMQIVPLDFGAIQTFADLASDVRVHAIYNSEGRIIRTVMVEAPQGFVLSDPVGQVLYALRRVGRQQLVEYKWRWGN
jgi:hypothetical protein